MLLSLNNLKPAKGATKKRKRVGRGNASGHGTYSTRGLKGQKSRSGVSNLKRKGFKMTLMRISKKRGFKSSKIKNQIINLKDLNKNFKDGDMINPKTLFNKGLIDDIKTKIKILGMGELDLKNIIVDDLKMSAKVKIQIEKNGAKIIFKKSKIKN
ncbi:50S ribosomal protein L15 [Candidatus Falkowbacteria bacterium CG_4_9_14_3_um_filter_36_9]|uniref:Large ribosomal subunit protein uL15 n=2 Tax=Candidatus Falkowiibacteriota TaxID=1752728 RepID=A0A1J4TCQ1_9BACT|nr:MAG: 50S ribosomal protein L15 [Candidatus Falkowbacteria bacterium CG1_02_37_44]PIV51894.1 MAG: 50S ribosomal protein L15 [Candidatus Falkowbacteria bacterium CG02_land_8_20_14_3_00_36_14]PIX12095.1 MAG: 50S ribosomal protein L15 [Candidatus Falkowbacteria bacterium CG_4_8_14_3_um_filter_36_11]PJA10859.1 MAG: 50S ribosomal protein L15 [Candidatus Falkowbacteria bacterium CG_4_10_14_0_2_um_filter_36_22]PJB20206.1 MAG: 50S ribosomal protein L15 [Candidatus Falkowbacteria bacterium CG_4_9_14_3